MGAIDNIEDISLGAYMQSLIRHCIEQLLSGLFIAPIGARVSGVSEVCWPTSKEDVARFAEARSLLYFGRNILQAKMDSSSSFLMISSCKRRNAFLPSPYNEGILDIKDP
jgi:hypothetical protein